MSAQAVILAASDVLEESNKTAFYVAGALLVIWAVLISVVGIARPSWPARAAAARAMMLLTVVLAAGAASTAVLTA